MKTKKLLARSLPAAALALGLSAATLPAAAQGAFTLESPDLASGTFSNDYVLGAFGCQGTNVSPALVWRNLPAGTKSLSLQVHDPDAPTGAGFWHWTVYNIPASATGLPRGAGNGATKLPGAAFGGTTDFQDTGATGANGNWGGPCPPVGDKPHRYNFTLYALAVEDVVAAAGVPRTGTASLMSFVLNKGLGDKLLGKATFTATYGR